MSTQATHRMQAAIGVERRRDAEIFQKKRSEYCGFLIFFATFISRGDERNNDDPRQNIEIRRKEVTMNNKADGGTQIILPDEEIISLYWERQERAIDATDVKYGKYLYTIAYNILRDGLDSEECLNDTYLGTWNSIPPNKPNALRAFLSKIIRNIALGRLRKRTARRRIPSEIIVSLEELDECMFMEADENEKYMIQNLSRVLNEYLHSLPERKTFIFVCRYYYSDTVESISKMLGLSANTILRDLSKIRSGLKERMKEEGYWYE